MPQRITYSQFGGPDVLVLGEAPQLDPGPGQVRVHTRLASVNPTDAKVRRGEMEAIFPVTFPVCPGVDVAGVVDAVGADDAGYAVGDEVFGMAAGGSYAEYVLLDTPVTKPGGVSWEVAAALPTAGETAVRAYRATAVQPGQTLLIHGAAGGIGSIVTQLAVRDQVTVIGMVGAADDDVLRKLGGVPVRYGDGWGQRVHAIAPAGVDAAIDTAGRGVLPGSIDLTGDPGRVVTLVDDAAFALGAVFTGISPGDRAEDALPLLAAMAADGQLTIPIWRTYPLGQAAQAHRDLEAGANRGKILLTTQENAHA